MIKNITKFNIETGLLYQNNEPVLEKDFKVISPRIWWECLKYKTNTISKLVLYPVGLYCPGNCSYCMHKNENKSELKILSSSRVKNIIIDLFQNHSERIDEKTFTFALTGGSPFYHNDIESILDLAFFIKKEYNKDVRFSYFLDGIGSQEHVDNIIKIINKYNKWFESKVTFSCDYGSNYRNSSNFNIRDRFKYFDKNLSLDIHRMIFSHYVSNFNCDDFCRSASHFLNNETLYTHKLYILTSDDLKFTCDNMIEDFDKIKKELPVVPNLRERGYFISNNLAYLDSAYFYPIRSNVWKKIRFNEMNCSLGNSVGISQSNIFPCFYGKWGVNSIKECINIPINLIELEEKLYNDPYCDTCVSKSVCPLCLTQRYEMPCYENEYIKHYINMLTHDRYDIYYKFYNYISEARKCLHVGL